MIENAGGEASILRSNLGCRGRMGLMFDQVRPHWGDTLDIFLSNAAVGSGKAALESLVRRLVVELAREKIRINEVIAGVVDMDALKYFPHRDDVIGNSLVKTSTGGLTEPRDVADLVLFLVSSPAARLVGRTVTVNCGYSILA